MSVHLVVMSLNGCHFSVMLRTIQCRWRLKELPAYPTTLNHRDYFYASHSSWSTKCNSPMPWPKLAILPSPPYQHLSSQRQHYRCYYCELRRRLATCLLLIIFSKEPYLLPHFIVCLKFHHIFKAKHCRQLQWPSRRAVSALSPICVFALPDYSNDLAPAWVEKVVFWTRSFPRPV